MASTQSEPTGNVQGSKDAGASEFYIAFPPAEIVQDTALIEYIIQLVNEVYTIAEEGIFDESYLRTNADEISKYIKAGQLALASSSKSSPWSPASNIQGCIKITRLSDTEGELGMLVAASSARRSGLGRQLVTFGEDRCRAWGMQRARVDLLVPIAFRHELKIWVQAWYERLGYRVFGLSDFKKLYPRLAPSVIGEPEFRMFAKDL